MITYLKYSDLDSSLIKQYKSAITEAFPEIILRSRVTEEYWSRLENYFPHTQVFMVDSNNDLLGFMNAIPIFWDQMLEDLPQEGWDWLLRKGISDFEDNVLPNILGGLQIIVTKKYQGQGYSKLLISKGKEIRKSLGLDKLIIPIRPILKHNHPQLLMKDYIDLKKNNKVYDPWIRTHLESGATLIKVCENSMNVRGNISFWEELLGEKITESGSYKIDGALNLVTVDLEENYGEYREENIWIYYD
ncbi:N-acetyltransferase [Aquimarina sp. AD1]|uniref:N-acetyltransferase n=1 Tax=Aquimarina sp. (strain AD1) TaxID=1714848 RepID=UPI000E535DF6|nr:N-acetyltransferase [Aquimarina sp. AD1]AXT55577.1 N-acetyltransferase [Aquimarina sp. AD1]RKN21669.1 N-acetyltransferase [Aquimarina sp. AD1]